jgi:hypothetical protein
MAWLVLKLPTDWWQGFSGFQLPTGGKVWVPAEAFGMERVDDPCGGRYAGLRFIHPFHATASAVSSCPSFLRHRKKRRGTKHSNATAAPWKAWTALRGRFAGPAGPAHPFHRASSRGTGKSPPDPRETSYRKRPLAPRRSPFTPFRRCLGRPITNEVRAIFCKA